MEKLEKLAHRRAVTETIAVSIIMLLVLSGFLMLFNILILNDQHHLLWIFCYFWGISTAILIALIITTNRLTKKINHLFKNQ